MTIATWNINGMQARLGFVRHWLQARTPDVVLLQELKLPADRFPHAELDAAGFHTAAERSRFQALSELGLVDLFRARHPDRRLFSWWDYRAGDFHQNRGLRIDLLLAALPVAARSGEVWIDRDYRKKKEGMIASDHAPVIAELAPVIAEPDPAAAPPRAAGGDGDGDGSGSG